jgi:hypothetical protein
MLIILGVDGKQEFHMYYVFLWVFPRRLSTKSRRFGTLYQFQPQKQVDELCYNSSTYVT